METEETPNDVIIYQVEAPTVKDVVIQSAVAVGITLVGTLALGMGMIAVEKAAEKLEARKMKKLEKKLSKETQTPEDN